MDILVTVAASRLQAQVTLGILTSGIVSMVAGVIWLLSPSIYVLEVVGGAPVLMPQFPNWRGLPLIALAAVILTTADFITHRRQVGTRGVVLLGGSLIAGLIAAVGGLAWLYTPNASFSGGVVNIEYPNWRGLPLLGIAALIWLSTH